MPRVILFREEHLPRVLVKRVDFVSAAAVTPGISRRGGPHALLTNMALFEFDKATYGFRLRSVHPPYSTADIRANTGFDHEEPENVPVTTPPDAAVADPRDILAEIAETYLGFAKLMMEAAESRVHAPVRPRKSQGLACR